MINFLRLWALVAVIALSIHLGGYPLFDADEGRNGEVGREMSVTNDYVMPHLDGLPYLDKPLVYFAAEGAAMKVLGPTEVAARLPALLFTLLTAGVCFWFARRLWSEVEGWIAAAAFLSMPLTIAFSRTVIFDSALSLFVTISIIAFYFAVESDGLPLPADPDASRPAAFRSARWPVIVAWASMGLGVLTKGPVAIALPLFVAIPYAIWQKRFRALWSFLGLMAFVVVIAPWVWAVSLQIPDFLHYVLVTETMQRMATKALKRTGPPWYFIPYLLGGALPWSIVLLAGTRSFLRRNRQVVFVLLWILVPFVFFSISQSKRPQYILPLMPAVALLVASAWQRLRPRIGAIVWIVAGAALAIAPAFVHASKMRPDLLSASKSCALAIGIVAIVSGLISLFAKRQELALAMLTLPILAIPLLANPALQAIGDSRSTQALVAQLAPYLTPQTQIVGVEAYTGSMSFYLRRPIIVATPDAEEFTSNYLIRHYDHFADDPTSTMRRPLWLPTVLDDVATPRLFLVRNNDLRNRALLEQHGLRLVATGVHFVAYTRPAVSGQS